MNGYELVAALINNLVWPVVVIVVLFFFRDQFREFIGRISIFKASRDGLEVHAMGEISKQVIGKSLPPNIVKEVERKQILEQGNNSNGSYTLYANGMIVARRMVTLMAGESKRTIALPIAMVNDATSVQFIGDIQAKVVSLNRTVIVFEFALSDVEREIEVVVAGL
ncbi:hypothetical protein [Pseudomonas sp. WS 5071]|uniref:hypothetical protein n=1 Tax=Pseudomonas sp. WS 5071 TaxID=2717479 RepID=UPI001475404A|nr:hypothetical protein [Pseudomonas sp. WS 5071]NMY73815.1 hypothetical protein [Pseudomonas sp. WS 5071]